MSPEEENQKLKKRIQELEEALEKVEEENKRLKKIEEEFDEFKAKHAVTVSNLQEALKIKADKAKSNKPLGLPKGHKGYFRHVPERWDKVQLKLNTCPDCHTRLLGAVQEERSRIVTDVELTLKAKNTKYFIPRKYCPACKKLVEPEVPNALPHARLGLNLMLLVMYLKLGLRLPCEKIVDFLSTAYGVKMSNGEVIVILKQLAGAFGNYYGYLEKLVKLARIKHSDTTSWRVNGRNYFTWVFISAGVVLYKIRKRNNHKVGLTVFGQSQKGNVLDSKTRFLIANNVTEERSIPEARQVFKKAKEATKEDQCREIVTDGLQAYGDAISHEFVTSKSRPAIRVIHNRNAGIRKARQNNNPIERYHNDFREFDKVRRGIGRVAEWNEGFRLFHNFIRENSALGKTPVQAAAIELTEGNKWLSLLRKSTKESEDFQKNG